MEENKTGDSPQEKKKVILVGEDASQEDIAKIQRVRRKVQQDIDAGTINESLLPRGPSVETLMAAAEEDKGTALANTSKVEELQQVYQQEMDYLNSVKPNYGSSRPKTRKVILYTGTAQDLIDSFRFSGKDDAYNTIEGLRHDGIAQDTRHALTSFGSGHIAEAAKKLHQGFSLSKIKELAKLAETSSVQDFAKHLGVELVDPNNMPVRVVMYNAGGGGYVWKEGMALSSEQKTFIEGVQKIGMKQNTAYVDPEIAQYTIGGKLGKSVKEIEQMSQAQKDSWTKYAIFHEAAERENALALHSRGQLPSDRMYKDPHRMSMIQEELFLRLQENKDTYHMVRKFRKVQDPKVIIPGKDDAYNTIEGLRHGGLAEHLRKALTEFGSGWDSLRAVATQMYKGVDPEEAFKLLRQSDAFQTALSKAVSKEVIGIGASGTTHLMTTPFMGKEFQFARKIGAIWEHEAAAMRSVEGSVSPSVYRSSGNMLDMELFRGQTLDKVLKKIPEGELSDLAQKSEEAFSALHKAGYRHGDPNLGNIFLIEHEGQKKIGLIDFGAAKKLDNVSKGQAQEFIAEDLNVGVGAIEEELRKRQGKGIGSTFKPSFMTEETTSFTSKIPQKQEEELDFMAFLGNTETVQKEKRLTNFRRVTKNSVGIGLRSAHNAGRGHCNSASNRGSNF
jgi:tRNA A-37 threonylcarbamoyl transferase component Bud32